MCDNTILYDASLFQKPLQPLEMQSHCLWRAAGRGLTLDALHFSSEHLACPRLRLRNPSLPVAEAVLHLLHMSTVRFPIDSLSWLDYLSVEQPELVHTLHQVRGRQPKVGPLHQLHMLEQVRLLALAGNKN